MESQLGFSHFIQQADGVAISLLLVLGLFSIGSWYLILTKAISAVRANRASDRFVQKFWSSPDLKAAADLLNKEPNIEPLARLAHKGFAALERYRTGRSRGLLETGSAAEFVERVMKQAYEEERLALETGMTWLATVASSAPFIGLFGTVWGIYHALLAIGLSGQGTLDKVAGPVGEALIMTAIGLAVAIPAAVAFNTFNRWNRRSLARLDSFAQDVLTVMSTGIRSGVHRLPSDVEATNPGSSVDRLASIEGQ